MNQNVYQKTCGFGPPKLTFLGPLPRSSFDRAWRPGVSKWRPGGPALAQRQRQLDYSSTFSRAGSENGGGAWSPDGRRRGHGLEMGHPGATPDSAPFAAETSPSPSPMRSPIRYIWSPFWSPLWSPICVQIGCPICCSIRWIGV